MRTAFKLYTKGAQKTFQREGNHYIFKPYLNLYDNSEIPQIVSGYFKVDETLTLTSFKLYRIRADKLIGAKYEDLVSFREEVQDLPLSHISIETITGTSKKRLVIDSKSFNLPIRDGYVYELVIVTNLNEFESELFGTFEVFDEKPHFQCSNASVPNVNYDEIPVFTIDVEELNEVAGSATISVLWKTPNKPVFGSMYFGSIFFGGLSEVPGSETKNYSGGEKKTFTFSLGQVINPGTYTLEYNSSFAGCSGSIDFTVANYFSIDDAGSGWQLPGTGADEAKEIEFRLKVDNAAIDAKVCQVDFNMNGVVETLEASIPGSSSYTFSRTYTVNRYEDNNLRVSGNAGVKNYSLEAIPPTP